MMAAAALLQAARAKGVMIATAESCTGGMVSAAITDVPGSSAIFDRGFVTYTNDAKVAMLGVRQATLDEFGAVSEQTALEMAQGALANSAAKVAVSVTGIAGPGGSDHKPEGRVCFGITYKTAQSTETVEFGALGRDVIRAKSTAHALHLLQQAVDSYAPEI